MNIIEMVSLRSSLPLEQHAGVDAGRDQHRVGQLCLALHRARVDLVAHLGPPGCLLSAHRRVGHYVGGLVEETIRILISIHILRTMKTLTPVVTHVFFVLLRPEHSHPE